MQLIRISKLYVDQFAKVQILAVVMCKESDHDDVKEEAKCHLSQHQVQSSVDVIDAELIERLTPIHQAKYNSHELQHIFIRCQGYRVTWLLS